MAELPNGFTGFSHRDPNFVSAGDAMRRSRYDDTPFATRKQEQSLAGGWGFAAPSLGSSGFAASAPRVGAASDILRYTEEGGAPGAPPRFDPEKLAHIPEADRRWSWVEIDLNAIRHNASTVKHRLSPGTRLMAVV